MQEAKNTAAEKSMEFVLREGKYAGHSLKTVVNTYEGYRYIQYLHQLEPGLMIPQEVWNEIDNILRSNPTPPPCSFEESCAFKLRFGKNKGRTMGQLTQTIEGQGYLHFLVNEDQMFEDVKFHSSNVLANCHIILPKLNDAMKTRMTFGKYAGTYLEDIIKSYRGRIYVEWLLLKPKNSTPYAIRLALQVIMDQVIRPQGSKLIPTAEDEAHTLRFGLFRGEKISDIAKRPAGRAWMAQLAESRYATWVQQQELRWYLDNP